jgi:excisionase family DNA binding protein
MTTAATEPPITLTTAEVAKLLDLSEERVRWLARNGHLSARRVYARGRWRYLLDEVERVLEPTEAS